MLSRCRSAPPNHATTFYSNTTLTGGGAEAVRTAPTAEGGVGPSSRSGKRQCSTRTTNSSALTASHQQRCRSSSFKYRQTTGCSIKPSKEHTAGGNDIIIGQVPCVEGSDVGGNNLLVDEAVDYTPDEDDVIEDCSNSSSAEYSNQDVVQAPEHDCNDPGVGDLGAALLDQRLLADRPSAPTANTSRTKKRNRKNISESCYESRPRKRQNKRNSLRTNAAASSSSTQSSTANTSALDEDLSENVAGINSNNSDHTSGTVTGVLDDTLHLGLEDFIGDDFMNTGNGMRVQCSGTGTTLPVVNSVGGTVCNVDSGSTVDEAVVVVGTPVSILGSALGNHAAATKVHTAFADSSSSSSTKRSSGAVTVDNPWGLSPAVTGGTRTHTNNTHDLGAGQGAAPRYSVDWMVESSVGSSSMACTPRPVPIEPRPSLPPLSPGGQGSTASLAGGAAQQCTTAVGGGGGLTTHTTAVAVGAADKGLASIDEVEDLPVPCSGATGGGCEPPATEGCTVPAPHGGTTHVHGARVRTDGSAALHSAAADKLRGIECSGGRARGSSICMEHGGNGRSSSSSTASGTVSELTGNSRRRSLSADGNMDMLNLLSCSGGLHDLGSGGGVGGGSYGSKAIGGGLAVNGDQHVGEGSENIYGLPNVFNNNVSPPPRFGVVVKKDKKDLRRMSVCGGFAGSADALYDGLGFDTKVPTMAANRRTSVDALHEITSVAGWEEEFLDSQVESPKFWSPTRPSQAAMAPDPRWKYRACEKKLQARLRAVADGDYNPTATTSTATTTSATGSSSGTVANCIGNGSEINISESIYGDCGVGGDSSAHKGAIGMGGRNNGSAVNLNIRSVAVPDVVMRTPTRG